MVIKTNGLGTITQYADMAEALRANDPFQRYARLHSAYTWLAHLHLEAYADESHVYQFERVRPLL